MSVRNLKVKNFINKLNIQLPIIQAPMAGTTPPPLIAVVSNAGGLGSFGAGYLPAKKIREGIKAIRDLTDKPFAVNLFVPQFPDIKKNEDKIKKMNLQLNSYREQLGLPQPSLAKYQEDFMEQISVIIEEKVPIFSFTFGIPSAEVIAQLKHNNILLMGTATTVQEAIEIEKSGCDVIIAQGSEAGGHRGTFLKEFSRSQIGTMALIPQIVDKATLPVAASGGIMDGRGLIAALTLGASGIQMGTAFLTCSESGIHELYKQAILDSTEESTVITKIFSGKPARGISNQFIEELENSFANNNLPDYPIQNSLTQDIRKAAAAQNKISFMSMWSGQGTRLSRKMSAKDLIQEIQKEANDTLKILCSEK